MLTSHRLLLKYRHDARFRFGDVAVRYVDRGAPGDLSSVSGTGIRKLESFCFTVESAGRVNYIPYHRIRRITYAGETVWER